MKKPIFAILLDTVLVILAYYLSFVLRLGRFVFVEYSIFLKTLPFVILAKGIIFYFYKIHRGIWKYASVNDLWAIIKAAGLSTLVIIGFVFILFRAEGYPRSVPIIDWLLTIIFIGGLRFVARTKKEGSVRSPYRTMRGGKRLLIVGAGNAGVMLFKEIKENPGLGYNLVGFIDDSKENKGMHLQGVPILGNQKDIPRIVRDKKVVQIILAIPSASGKEMRSIVKYCEYAKVKFKTLPALGNIINGTVSMSQTRNVNMSDLLRRVPAKLDTRLIASHLSGKRVMVTGAGGSIGRELCFQIAKYNPDTLILFERAETALFFTELDIKREFPHLKISTLLADMRDFSRCEQIIKEQRPEIIYHAAAYKHVPMLEINSVEGIKNNVFGTQNLADLAYKYGIEEFVMVSTDKAVNPKNLMGLSKRINEIYVQTLSKRMKNEELRMKNSQFKILNSKFPIQNSQLTKFITVRFGNVLGTSGSVVPVFKKQIEDGGPITITHKQAKRYFMTMGEAGQLIITAGAMGKGGEIFILQMGEQVKITDLAQDMIALSGYRPEDIKIVFTGLRPGEKLSEQLVEETETAKPTTDDKILVVESNNYASYQKINDKLTELKDYLTNGNTENITAKCKEIINS